MVVFTYPQIAVQLSGGATETTLVEVKNAVEAIEISNASIDAKLSSQATAAKQDALLAELQLKADLTETQPVSVATLPLPTGAATAANQATANASLSSIDSKLTAPLSVTGPLTDVQLRATPVPVSGTVAVSNFPATQAVSAASLPLPTGAATETTLAAINTKTPLLGQATMANSTPVTLASNQSAIPISQTSVVSTANSSTVALGVSGVFTGTSEQVQDYAAIEVSVFANQASAANGLSMQQSQDGTNWDFVDNYTIPASTGKVFSVAPCARFFRVVYTNGTTLQTTFRLQVVYHYSVPRSSTHSLADTITLQNDAELVIAQLRATNSTNSVPLIADASGNLSVNVGFMNGVATAMGAGNSSTGTQRVVIATDQLPIPAVPAPSSSSTNALSKADSTAFEASRVVKASAGRLYQLTGYNSSSAGTFVQIHNTTSVPADGVAPVVMFFVPPQSNFSYELKQGDYFSTGITVCVSSTGPTKTIAGAIAWFNARYL